MKLFYILTLLFGFSLAILMQFADFALPRDAFVAGVLSRSPDSWTLSLDDATRSHLSGHDVKAEVTLALEKRHSFRSGIYLESFWEGIGVIVFALIGLMREKKIDGMRKWIDQAAAMDAGSAAKPPASTS